MNRLFDVLKKIMAALRWESITSTDFVFLGGFYLGLRVLICSTFICGFFIELCRFMGFPVVVEVLIRVIRRMPWRKIKSNKSIKSIFLIAFYFMLRLTGSRWFLVFLINSSLWRLLSWLPLSLWWLLSSLWLLISSLYWISKQICKKEESTRVSKMWWD